MSERKTLTIVLPATVVAMLWGGNFVVLKELVVYAGPLTIVAVQFLVCVPFLFLVPTPPKIQYVLLWGLTAGLMQYGMQIKGLELGVSPGIASVLLQLQAFFTPLLLTIIMRENFSVRILPALSAGFIGIYFLASSNLAQNSMHLLAILLLVGASFAWAVGNIAVSLMDDGTNKTAMLPVVVHAGAYMSLPVLAWAYYEEGMSLARLSTLSLGETLFVCGLFLWVILAYLGGYFIWNSLIDRYGAQGIVRYSLLVPIFGVLFSYILYGDQISVSQGAGIALILFALTIYHLQEERNVQHG